VQLSGVCVERVQANLNCRNDVEEKKRLSTVMKFNSHVSFVARSVSSITALSFVFGDVLQIKLHIAFDHITLY